jgi:2,5-diketo-D-gluconate reductase A
VTKCQSGRFALATGGDLPLSRAVIEIGRLMPPARLRLNDGHSIPQLGLGIWQVPAESTAATVKSALELGYRLIDGAAIYGNEAGLGAGVRTAEVTRDEVFVTTKVWNSEQGYDSTLRAVDASLKRLGLDRVELCLIHWPTPARDRYLDTWRALIRAREDGKVRSIGVSNFMAPHLERLVGETGVVPVLNQLELNPRLQQTELRALHDRMGIVTQSWTPLGQGASFAAAPVQEAAARTGKSPAQVILRWHVQLGVSVIPRSTRVQGLTENLDVFDFSLTPEEMAAISTLDEGARCGPDPMTFS